MNTLAAATLVACCCASAQDPPLASAALTALLAKFEQTREETTRAITKTPDRVELYSQRGDCELFLGHFSEAVHDFEKMIMLDPKQDAPHWRLGIAYYFAGDFEKSARQFEKYHVYDGHDRENGIWKFCADARAVGIEKARRQMLAYTQFDREPFPALYAMFAGKAGGDDVFAEMKSKRLGGDVMVQFFAHYYVGLNEELLGRRDTARSHLGEAVRLLAEGAASRDPGYMWEVARLEYELLSKGSE